ncbi:Uncharacterised protein, partial [Metamycoplasma alkalescens]
MYLFASLLKANGTNILSNKNIFINDAPAKAIIMLFAQTPGRTGYPNPGISSIKVNPKIKKYKEYQIALIQVFVQINFDISFLFCITSYRCFARLLFW